MQTMQINLIEPNALKVLQGLEDLKLIQIQQNKTDKKDSLKMTEAEFYAMIDKSLESGLVPMSLDELKAQHRI
ncbi:MAG: hypothetical protein KGV51_02330 [Moraxellaceae bacterium]|nr:hypothetical protein [Moraxellaceae bacterium]